MKHLLLALGTSLVVGIPSMASPDFKNDPSFRHEYFKAKPITGKVTDDKGEPLAGVTVQVKGLKTSTVTKADGTFVIDVPNDAATLVFSFVGMERKEVSISGKSDFQIQLKTTNASLDEVVVVGYGTQRAKAVTGSVATVDVKKLENIPTATITEALSGQVPGLSVTGVSSRPGVKPSIDIRQQFGWSKDGGFSSPLIVIDDIIQINPEDGKPSMEAFNNLDVSEVESITVLRDASAAIYGSRGSQGAIVVKTKRGKPGAPKISYSGRFQYNDAVSHPKVMSAYEHGIFTNRYGRSSGWADANLFNDTELEKMKSLNYDWRKEAWKSAGTMQHSVNVSGGADKATYFAGASYYSQGANMGSQDYARWSFRTGADVKVANNLKLSATVAGNSTDIEKSFTKVSLNDGLYTRQSEQTDYAALAHMPRYIPWQYNVNGVDQFISPALGTTRPTTSVNNNNITGWNYFALLNNGSKTLTNTFNYNTNFSLQYDLPFIKGLSVKGSYGLSYSTDNNEQVMLPQTLSVATNIHGAGTHLYDPSTTTWFTGISNGRTRVGYTDRIGKMQQANFFVNYDNTFGLHNIAAMASVEKSQQDYQNKTVLYESTTDGYNGASSSAGILNTSNTIVGRSIGGSLSYLGRVNYNYDSKYLLTFLFRADASTKFAPENYWGFFPSLSAGWVVSKESWFNDKFQWVNYLKLRASLGKTGIDNVKPWKWAQLYSYAADKGLGFGSNNGGMLVAGVNPDATPNRNLTWDQTIKRNIGVDASFLRSRLSISVDQYYDHITDMLTVMGAQVGTPVTVGGAFAEQNFAAIKTWGTELSATWRDKVGAFDYSIGMNFATENNKVTKYMDVAFDYPSKIERKEGYSTIRPAYGFITWKGTSTGDGLLRSQEDIDAYWSYLTDLATKAGTTAKYLGGDKTSIKTGMLAYEDRAGALDADKETIAGQNGQINEDEDYAELVNRNRSYGINTNLGLSWKSLSLQAQLATNWGGYTAIDYLKQPTSSGQMFWSRESYLNDMYDATDNVNGKYPSLAYYSQNSYNSDFWQISSFRCYIRSLSFGYNLPKEIARKIHMDGVKLSLSGVNMWDFYNPYPNRYRNMYDSPTSDYPTLRTWTFGVNATF
jgi:TonB-linked SusC/RagA family outer membrane protein